jgi:hypothetical protein
MANSKKGTAQVNPPTPKQRVNAAYGSKSALVDEIIALIGAGDRDVRGKLMQVSNSRLMSHHHNAKRMVAKYGSRDGIVEAICAKKFPNGDVDEHYRARLEGYSAWRLIDVDRQVDDGLKTALKAASAAERNARIKKKRRDRIKRRRAARKA